MSKKFNCPSCGAPMEYKGGDSLFQNCEACTVPVVVPSRIAEPDRDKGIESTVGMPPESVMKAESLTQIHDHLDEQEARVKKEKEAGVINDPILDESKKAIEDMVSGKQSTVEVQPEEPAKQTEIPREPNPQIMEEIFNEVRAGNKVRAIKLYSEAYNTSLEEAKEMVEKAFVNVEVVEESKAEEPKKVDLTPDAAKTRLGIILHQLQTGNKILAIKTFREEFGTGLREAKDAVEAMERGENIRVSDYV